MFWAVPCLLKSHNDPYKWTTPYKSHQWCNGKRVFTASCAVGELWVRHDKMCVQLHVKLKKNVTRVTYNMHINFMVDF